MRNINILIKDHKFKLARLEAAHALFDDIELYNYSDDTLRSKKARKQLNNIKIIDSFNLVIEFFHEFTYQFEGKIYTDQIASVPNRVSVCLQDYNTKELRFQKIGVKLSKDLEDKIKVAIVNFIAKHPNSKLDTKNLDKRIKKLLAFS